MTTVLVFCIGWLLALGLWLIWTAGQDVVIRTSELRVALTIKQTVGALVGGLLMLLLTRWPAAGFYGLLAGWSGPLIVQSVQQVREAQRIDEALPIWLETLRGSVVSGTAIGRAVEDSVGRVNPAIRPQVEQLAITIRERDLRTGLRQFASEMAHPLVDIVVLALILTDRHGGAREDVLDWVVRRLRKQTVSRQEIEASRRKVYVQVSIVVLVSVLMFIYLLLFSRDYLEPYGSARGQLVLLAVGGVFCLAGLWLSRLVEDEPEERPFSEAFDQREVVR